MNPLQPNPKTGFLESLNPLTNECFSSEKKLKLLQTAREFCDRHEVPDLASLADQAGITMRTFYKHLELDEKFMEAWNEIKARMESWLIQSLGVKAKSANGVVANLALLRDINPGRWNPEARIIHTTNNSQAKEVSGRISGYLDAEIVDNSPLISSPQDQVDKSTNVPDVKREL